MEVDASTDEWSAWLLHRRHADDAEYGRIVQETVEGYASRVISGAKLEPGMTLVDVGSGEGLVAFKAIEQVGPSLQVLLTDVSQPMLQFAEASAVERGITAQCTFLECPATDLHQIAGASVDVVTTRSVLAYVQGKYLALSEFHRILKPGGRISLAEPLFQDEAFEAIVLRRQVELLGERKSDLFIRLLHRWKAAQFPDTEEVRARSPHANYSERDLLNLALTAGFTHVHLELIIDVKPSPVKTWEVFLGISPHPWAPSLRQILAEEFSPEEQQFFEQIVRPTVEAGGNTATERMVFLTAKKPDTSS